MFFERDPFDLVSILTLKSEKPDGLDIFYILDSEKKTYVEKTEKEIRQQLGHLPKAKRTEFNNIFEHNHTLLGNSEHDL